MKNRAACSSHRVIAFRGTRSVADADVGERPLRRPQTHARACVKSVRLRSDLDPKHLAHVIPGPAVCWRALKYFHANRQDIRIKKSFELANDVVNVLGLLNRHRADRKVQDDTIVIRFYSGSEK